MRMLTESKCKYFKKSFAVNSHFYFYLLTFEFTLIDYFRCLVYPKVNSMNYKMGSERFTDIYLK
jgi:hypothetical protein